MVQPSTQSLTALLLTGCLACSLFASPVIGVAIANGPFLIDRSQVTGNASLFEGSEVVTEEASSKLRLNGGARLEIGAGSQIRVFASRAVLERGAGQVEGPPAYSLQALTLHIAAAAPKAIARVRLDGSDAVLVSAFNGPVRVSTAAGLLVATVAPGRNLRFQPGAAAADSFEVTGCLLKKSGRFIIVDSTSNQVFEVRGAADLADKLGNRVTVKGTEVEGAAQVIAIQSVTDVAPGGCLATAASVGADPPPGATAVPKTVAASKGANRAVILGVVIAAAAGGGIAVALSQSKKSASPQ